MRFSGDPFDDFDRYDLAQERALARLPKCSICGEPIQDEHYYEFEDGRKMCPECLDANYKHWTDEYEDLS